MKIIYIFFTLLIVNINGNNNDFINPDEITLLLNNENEHLTSDPEQLTLVKGETKEIIFTYKSNLTEDIYVIFNTTVNNVHLNPTTIVFGPNNDKASINATGLHVTSLTFIDVKGCENANQTSIQCPFDQSSSFLRVKVVHSNTISLLVTITGWIYFVAWSISFYPQIFLNYQRKSVEGLNFDFLVLNILGFLCYTIYNWLMYFDSSIQDLYLQHHHRSLIPVLLNDVVFSSHALLACLITGIQCFFYERGSQRVSYTCIGWSSLLSTFAIISFIITAVNVIDWLQFINNLSYVKMAVTMSKYFPQAILNFKRKSTVGWSIGNVLLDFTGGFMDICQMILQASNSDDWSGFYGNPVKFGLGLISMIFDILFMIQHYCLYRNHIITQSNYDVVDTTDNPRPNAY